MLPLISLLPVVTAHLGCAGQHIGRRNEGGGAFAPLVQRQVDNNNIDPAAECAPYNYQPATALGPKYPAIWKAADLVAGDSEAETLFNEINATVSERLPNAQPYGNGNHMGDWGPGFSYPQEDPNCWWTETKCTTPNPSTNVPADITQMPEPDTWGFGFDDGPNCSHNALYNFLQANDQKATMFFIGSNVMDWPIQAKRAHDDGHQICVHTWSHGYMTSFDNRQAFAELYYTQRAIKDIVGVTPKCWRPPYGDVDNRIRLIAHLLNMTTIVWSEDTDDWHEGTGGVTPDNITANYQKIITKAKNGEYSTHGPIVLNHELNNFTMQELISEYPSIKAAFKNVVPIATGYNITNPYMESNITYPDFNTYVGGNDTATQANSTQITGSNAKTSSKNGTSSTRTSASSVSTHSGARKQSFAGALWVATFCGVVAHLA